MPVEAENPTFTNDAFISYSRKDIEFARKLEKALEDYKPPKDLNVPQRRLEVFRDEEDFTGVEYYESIEKHLRNSRKMIVICSPNARKREFVNDEIRRFAEIQGADNVIPVLLSGIPNNEAKPGQEEEKAFPEALCKAMEMPLATDYRGFTLKRDKPHKGRFEGNWYTILANLYDLSRAEVEQREKKRQARRLKITVGIVSGVILMLLGLLVYALISRQEAIKQRGIAEKNEGIAKEQTAIAQEREREAKQAAEAERKAKEGEKRQREVAEERARIALSRQAAAYSLNRFDSSLDQSLLLAAQAYAVSPTAEARGALLKCVHPTRATAFLFGHGAPVIALAYAPGGSTIASADIRGNVLVWKTVNGADKEALPLADRSPALSLCFCENGNHLVVGQLNGRVSFWDISAKPPLLRNEVHWRSNDQPAKAVPIAIQCLDGKGRVAMVNTRGQIAVLDTLKGEISWEGGLDVGERSRYTSAISADGDVVLASNMGTISMWKVGRSKPLWVRDMPEVRRENEPFVLSAERVLPEMGWTIVEKKGDPADLMPPVLVEFVSSGIVVVGTRERLRLLERKSGKDTELPEYFDVALRGITFRSFATIGRISSYYSGGTPGILIIPTNEGARRVNLKSPYDFEVKGRHTPALSSAFSPSGDHFVIGYEDGSIAVWSTQSETPLEREITLGQQAGSAHRLDLEAAVFDGMGETLALASYKKLGFVNVKADTPRATFFEWPHDFDSVNVLALDSSGRFLGVGSRENQLQVWDLKARKLRRAFPENPKASVMDIKFLRGGHWLAAGRKGTLEVWEVETGKRVLEPLQAHADWITFLAKSDDDSLLASGSEDGTIIVWDAKLGTPRKELELKSHYVPLAASFLSQRLLTVGHKDGSVVVWDIDRRKRLWEPKTILDEPIVAVQGIKDSDELYVAGKSGRIAIVDFRTGFTRIEILPTNSNRRFGAISSDGRLTVSFDKSGPPVLLNLDPRRWAELACSRVGRSLNREEWASFVGPEIKYDPACIDGRYEGSRVGD